MATVQSILTIWLLVYLISMLYVGPTCFRRLGSLIEILRTRHPQVFEDLHRPSLGFMEISPRNSMSMLMYVMTREYQALNDEEAVRFGDEARWRLMFHFIGFGMILLLPVVAIAES